MAADQPFGRTPNSTATIAQGIRARRLLFGKVRKTYREAGNLNSLLPIHIILFDILLPAMRLLLKMTVCTPLWKHTLAEALHSLQHLRVIRIWCFSFKLQFQFRERPKHTPSLIESVGRWLD